MIPGFLLIPGGMGTAVPAMTSALLASVDRHFSGTASGVLNACRQAAGRGGVAVMGALAAGGPERIAAGLRASGLIAAAVLLVAAWIAWRSEGRRTGRERRVADSNRMIHRPFSPSQVGTGCFSLDERPRFQRRGLKPRPP
jgi:hypothetical protein